VEPIDDDSSHVYGNLTMHGITREVKLEVVLQGTATDPWDKQRAGIEAVGALKRSDFDMKFNQALGSGNVLVGDRVKMRWTSPRSSRPDGAAWSILASRREVHRDVRGMGHALALRTSDVWIFRSPE